MKYMRNSAPMVKVVKTLGFQLRDKSSNLFRSDGRVILSVCIWCDFIGYNGNICIKPGALCFLTYCGFH